MILAKATGVQGVEPPLQPKEVAMFVKATLPPDALIAIGEESVTSGVGKDVVPPDP